MNQQTDQPPQIESKPLCHFKHDKPDHCKKYPRKGMRFCHQHRRYETCGPKLTKPESIVKAQIETNESLRQRALELRESGVDLMDLKPALSLFRVLTDDLSNQIKSNTPLEELKPTLEMLLAVSESNRKTVDTIERIRNSTAMTASEVAATAAVIELMRNDMREIFLQSANADEFETAVTKRMLDTVNLIRQR